MGQGADLCISCAAAVTLAVMLPVAGDPRRWRNSPESFVLAPQTPGAGHAARLASSHKLGRAFALAGVASRPELRSR